MDKFLAVTRFKADDVHLNIEQIGEVRNQINRPGPTLAREIASQIRSNVDIDPTHSICDRVNDTLGIGGNGRLGGIFDAVNSDISANSTWARNQIEDVRNFGSSFYGSGLSGCRFNAQSPPNILDNLQSSVFGQARNFSRLNFNLDSLLIGEDLRRLLLRGINSLCGMSINDPFGDMFQSMRDLFNILDNASLFSNSDLLSAIGRCRALQPEHSRYLSYRTSNLARTGNTRAVRDVLTNIPDTRIMTDDVTLLCNSMEDTDENTQDILDIISVTNRSPKEFISSPLENPLSVNPSMLHCASIQKINLFNGKPTLVKALVKNSDLTINPGTTTKYNVDVLNRVSELVSPVQMKATEKGKIVTQTTSQEKIILKNNTDKIFSGITEHRKSIINELTSANRNPDINFGIRTPSIDFSNVFVTPTTIRTKSTMGTTWNNSVTEAHIPPTINNFISPKEDSLLLVNQPSLAYVEKEVTDREVTLNILKKELKINTHPFNKIQKFGTTVTMKQGCINGWKRIKQEDGHEVRFAVY